MNGADWLLALPIAIPLFACAAGAALHGRHGAQRVVTLASASALLVVSFLLLFRVQAEGVLASQMGDWPAPFGITLVADLLGAAMVVIGAVMYLAVAVYALADGAEERERQGWHPLLGGLMLRAALRLHRDRTALNARGVLKASVLYLPLLYMALLLDSRPGLF